MAFTTIAPARITSKLRAYVNNTVKCVGPHSVQFSVTKNVSSVSGSQQLKSTIRPAAVLGIDEPVSLSRQWSSVGAMNDALSQNGTVGC